MRYETATNRADERATADVLEPVWHCKLRRLPPLSPVDYYAERDDRLVALVEIKCRERPLSAYPVVWIDAHKWWMMRDAAEGFHTRALFVVRCSDVILYCDLESVDGAPGVRTWVGGRTDRNDANDRDLIVCIPREHFHTVPLP